MALERVLPFLRKLPSLLTLAWHPSMTGRQLTLARGCGVLEEAELFRVSS